MTALLLLAITLVLGYVAYDAFSLRGGYKALPYRKIAQIFGRDVSYLSPAEQERRKQHNLKYGLGDADQSPWVFLMLFLASAIATAWEFLR